MAQLKSLAGSENADRWIVKTTASTDAYLGEDDSDGDGEGVCPRSFAVFPTA